MPGWLGTLHAGWRRRTVCLAVVVVLCGGCEDDLRRYYPLEEGRTWQYRVTLAHGDKDPVATTAMVVNLPAQPLLGRTAVPQRSQLFGQTVVRFFAEDGYGLLEYAQQLPDEPPMAKERPSYVLREPLAVGTSWSSSWRSAKRGATVSFPVVKAITSVDDTVLVPAGTFTGCLHLRITGRAEIDVGTGLAHVEVTGDEWYAPGVGFIKGAFRETVNTGQAGSELSIVLESFGR